MAHLSLISRFQVLRRIFPNRSYAKHRMQMKTYSSSSDDSSLAANSSKNFTPFKMSEDVFNTCFADEGEQFRFLLRNSNFVNMGDPENKIVRGKIFKVVQDDLYIDFGWKFYCVCPRPPKGGELYVRGAEVLLRIKALELSSKFLGAEKALTLLEADASIVRLLSSPVRGSSDS